MTNPPPLPREPVRTGLSWCGDVSLVAAGVFMGIYGLSLVGHFSDLVSPSHAESIPLSTRQMADRIITIELGRRVCGLAVDQDAFHVQIGYMAAYFPELPAALVESGRDGKAALAARSPGELEAWCGEAKAAARGLGL